MFLFATDEGSPKDQKKYIERSIFISEKWRMNWYVTF